MTTRLAILAVTSLLIVGCTVPNEVEGTIPGRSPVATLAGLPPRDDIVDPGYLAWQRDFAPTDGDSDHLEVAGPWFNATILNPDLTATMLLGEAATGETIGEWTVPNVSGWPLLVPGGDDPGVLYVTGIPPQDQTLTLRTADGIGFSAPASDYGAKPGQNLKAERAESHYAVLRIMQTPRTDFDQGSLQVIDTRTGQPVWAADILPRRTQVGFDLLSADYNSAGDPTAPSDRVRTWRLSTGAVVADEAITQERASPPLLCGGAVSPDRLLYCGTDLALRGELLIVSTDGEIVLRQEYVGTPAVDRDAGVVGITRPDDTIAAFDVETGAQLWSWSAEDSQGRRLGNGRSGFLLGALGESNIVVDSTTGEIMLLEPFYAVPDSRWNGEEMLRFEPGGLTARRGSGPLLGHEIPGEKATMFLRSGA